MSYIKGLIACFGMFSIIPMPYFTWDKKTTSAILPTYPILGAALGGLWWLFAGLLFKINPQSNIFIILIVVFTPIITGFIHLDGLMDTADAVLSRRPDLNERRRILKDSTVGSFAVAAAIIYFLLLYGAVSELYPKGNFEILIITAIVSRAVSGIATMILPSMSTSSYAKTFTEHIKNIHLILPVLTLALALYFSFVLGYILPISIAIIIGIVLSIMLYRNLEGFSGDLAGCVALVVEVSCLIGGAL